MNNIKIVSINKFMIGLLVVLILILSLIIVKSSKDNVALESYEKEINKIEYFSSSDEVGDIETDLINTDFDTIGTELDKIESELN